VATLHQPVLSTSDKPRRVFALVWTSLSCQISVRTRFLR